MDLKMKCLSKCLSRLWKCFENNLIIDPNPFYSRSLDLSKIGQRKSAFQPYKPATVLTNLQRGNTQTSIPKEIRLSFHEKTAQGEITEEQVRNELRSVDETDSKSFTALHWACYYGQYNSANVLIK